MPCSDCGCKLMRILLASMQAAHTAVSIRWQWMTCQLPDFTDCHCDNATCLLLGNRNA
jgi:hypothetical protein